MVMAVGVRNLFRVMLRNKFISLPRSAW